jgi:predicted enzyme related to lactoylglutathione lyase
MHVRAIDFVLLPVADLARSAKFYREILGLEPAMFSEEYQWAEFRCGHLTLAFKGGEQPAAAGGGMSVALAVADVRAACAELEARGVTIVSAPTDFKVCWCAEIRDPDGHSLLLHQRADGTAG